MSDLQELIDTYGTMKSSANKLYSDYKDMQVKLSELRNELQIKLTEIGLKSAKSASFGVSITTKPNIQVLSETSVIEWLNNTPNIESNAYIGLRTASFKKLALQVIKETGEIIPGTELENTETLTIKKNKLRLKDQARK